MLFLGTSPQNFYVRLNSIPKECVAGQQVSCVTSTIVVHLEVTIYLRGDHTTWVGKWVLNIRDFVQVSVRQLRCLLLARNDHISTHTVTCVCFTLFVSDLSVHYMYFLPHPHTTLSVPLPVYTLYLWFFCVLFSVIIVIPNMYLWLVEYVMPYVLYMPRC